jgi:hypothetical protein
MDLNLEIRPFTPSDQTGVVQLWGEVFPNDPPWNDPAELIRRKLSVQPELFLVAHGNGRILGTVLAGVNMALRVIESAGTHSHDSIMMPLSLSEARTRNPSDTRTGLTAFTNCRVCVTSGKMLRDANHSSPNHLEHLHDVCLVRPFKIS